MQSYNFYSFFPLVFAKKSRKCPAISSYYRLRELICDYDGTSEAHENLYEDTDAAYRSKGGKKVKGFATNITETRDYSNALLSTKIH